ncbi:RND transporter [Ralstonia solanacearum]|uniref:efflux transporter outer membrane subunit n=1 Tax=Ralstonia solanacearum TaxID=305 RepID=UPI000313E6C9|nr:efflux transporter outer membrane subunit [Ralstonia solanacearum]MDC6212968.1 efflux transporter outer membrane subunit [Ralstonia solanacearum]MDC6242083.1 efflux transporter outer membrane subunit [Ralstonia solanacearum]MDD7803564.1 efflux transporter outer membrane subunit [Ralstonia solanacearum]TYZ52646.1 RND transporter [Ralstonia solanacearum]
MRFRILPLALFVTFALSACSLKPEFVKPAAPIPAAYPLEARIGAAGHAADLGWRTMFGDPQLQRLIGLALLNNRDLRLATLNVEAVQAQYGIQRAARLPSIDATGSSTRQRAAANRDANPAIPSNVQEQVGLSIGLSAFEIDLFGRVRSLSDAAFARYLASDHGRRAAQISLVSAVADSYFAELLAQEQLQLAERTLADWRQSLDLARRLKAAYQNSGLDVAQAEGQVATAEADLEARTRAVALTRNALQLLVGAELPDRMPRALPLHTQPVVTQLPEGLPSELLYRRPDIQQAEQNLVAANADIGAARAAFFPRLSLTASLGYASPAMSSLFDGGQRVWNFAPQITVPLFQGGRLRSELRLAEVRTSSAVAEYERAVQLAFREVADGLAGRETYGRQIEAQLRAVASAERRTELSNLRYRAGTEGRLELLDAQRQLYAARQALLDLRRSEFGNAVALYKALGGGLIDRDAASIRQP